MTTHPLMAVAALAAIIWLAACDRGPDAANPPAGPSPDVAGTGQAVMESLSEDQRLAAFFDEIFADQK